MAAPGVAAPGRITASRMSWVPLTTGPATNTGSPWASAPRPARAPPRRTTVSLTSCQVSVVPSAARTPTELPSRAVMVPRSKAMVRIPEPVRNVNCPYMPPSSRSPTRCRTIRRPMASGPAAGGRRRRPPGCAGRGAGRVEHRAEHGRRAGRAWGRRVRWVRRAGGGGPDCRAGRDAAVAGQGHAADHPDGQQGGRGADVPAGAASLAAGRMLAAARGLVVGIHARHDAAAAWDIGQRFLGAAWEQPGGPPPARGDGRAGTGRGRRDRGAGRARTGYMRPGAGIYMRSGTGMPSRPRPVTSTRRVSADSASRLCRSAGSAACSTGHCS